MRRMILALIVVLAISAPAFATGTQQTPAAQAAPVLRVFLQDRPERTMSNELPIMAEKMRQTGTTVQWETAPTEAAAATERFNIMIASGDIPDIVVWNNLAVLNKAAQDGAFLPLNEHWQNAPNFKALVEDRPLVLSQLRLFDGNIYYFPFVGLYATAQVYMLRQDWLDTLGLQMPKTIQEWETVLRAFRDRDPNGTGKDDTVPFTTRSRANGILPFTEAWGLGGFGAANGFYPDRGRINHSFTDPRMKDALTWLNRMYSEKLIDAEYLTNDVNVWQSRISTHVAGSTHDWYPRIAALTNAVKATNPAGLFDYAMPPVGPDGRTITWFQQPLIRGGTAIARNSKNIAAAMRFIDHNFSPEGKTLMGKGVEGIHYTMVDEVPEFVPAVENHERGVLYKLFEDGRVEWATAGDPDPNEPDYYKDVIEAPLPNLFFTEDERRAIDRLMPDIVTYQQEMIDKFIMGVEPISKFDDFVATINRMGLVQVLETYQTVYARQTR